MTQPCTYKELIEKWKKDIPDIQKLVYKAVGGIGVLVFLVGLYAKIGVGTVEKAQAQAQEAQAATVTEIKEKAEKTAEKVQALEVNTTSELSSIKSDMQNVKEDVKEIKDTNKEILEAIKAIKE